MRKNTKTLLVIATFLIVIGLIMFTLVMKKFSWDFTKLSTTNFETNTYEIDEAFNNISMDTDTADIIFALSNNGKCLVKCYEDSNEKHFVTTKEDTLIIKRNDNKNWYNNIKINFNSPKITVYLPKTEYNSILIMESTGHIKLPDTFKFNDVNISLSTGNVSFSASATEKVKIKASTGNINVKNMSAKELDLSVSTGDISILNVTCESNVNINVSTGKARLNNIECENLNSNGDTGDIFLENINIIEKLYIKRSTGDVKLDSSDAGEIYIKTDTGDVTGNLISEKIFITQTDTGSIDVPKTVNGGKCEIITDTGDVKITLSP